MTLQIISPEKGVTERNLIGAQMRRKMIQKRPIEMRKTQLTNRRGPPQKGKTIFRNIKRRNTMTASIVRQVLENPKIEKQVPQVTILLTAIVI